ncbi:MAG: hypothetical protein ABIP39_15725 [Polyangiaceae bacterium]
MTSAKRLALLGLVSVLFVVLAGGAHARSVGARAMRESDEAFAKGDLPTAIVRAHAAAEAVVPTSPYPARGYARLDTIARDAESRGDDASAAAAWRAMRSAAMATRTSEPWLERANQGISRVGARIARSPDDAARCVGSTDAICDSSAIEKRIETALAEDDTPSTLTFLLLGSGSLLFFFGAARLLAGTQR